LATVKLLLAKSTGFADDQVDLPTACQVNHVEQRLPPVYFERRRPSSSNSQQTATLRLRQSDMARQVATCLALQGRFDKAFPQIENAWQLDPLSLIVATDYGAILYFSRQYDRALEHFRGGLEMEPDLPRAPMLVWAYAAQKRLFAEALGDAEAYQRRENAAWSWVMIAYVSGRSGGPSKGQTRSQATGTARTE
jgi:tetratricopeptide (TPR) repeat protein